MVSAMFAPQYSHGLTAYTVCPCSVQVFTQSFPPAGEQINLPSSSSNTGQQQVVCLLVDSQYGAREISHMMFNAPGVNFALINPVVYGNCSVYAVVIRVLSRCLRELWLWLFTTSQELLLANGLLSIVLQSGTFVWARDGPTIATAGESQLAEHSSEPPALHSCCSFKGAFVPRL